MTVDPDIWRSYRSEFAEADGYLNFARYGPPSRAVLTATTEVLRASAAPTVGTMEEIRSADQAPLEAVARLLGIETSSVTFVPNTSSGLFHTALGLPHGTVAVSPAEFPANVYPWRRAEQLGRVRVATITSPTGHVTADAVRQAVDADTVAVSVSAVDFQTGYRADLGGIREVIGDRLLVVDATQAFGATDQAWEVADVLVAGGQKWLRAGWSTGFMAVSDRALERLEPVLTGWTGVEAHTAFDGRCHPPKAGAARFALSNTSPVSAASLTAAVQLIAKVGADNIDAAIRERVDAILGSVRRYGGTLLSPPDPDRRAGIVAFSLSGRDPVEIQRAMEHERVAVTVRGQVVRVAPHASTTTTSLEMFDTALARAARG